MAPALEPTRFHLNLNDQRQPGESKSTINGTKTASLHHGIVTPEPSPYRTTVEDPEPSPDLSKIESPYNDESLRHDGDTIFHKSHRVKSFGAHQTAAGGEPRGPSDLKSDAYHRYYRAFPRISKPVELLKNSYDTVVIGSGYGGAVAASRMARAGHSVCLLERGKERWPGEYPTDLADAAKEVHVSGDFAPGFLEGTMVDGGNPTGLYHLYCGKGQNVFVGNGLGGTSLLNANVFLEADEATLAMHCWPEELRRPGALSKYYERAAAVLEPKSYPKSWPELPKLSLLEKQAKLLGQEENFYRPRLTTRFGGGHNSTGVEMYPSALTGQDTTGLNDGSKSSTLVNYLSDAWNWGAEMFCESEVRHIKKDPHSDGYLIFFAWHGNNRGAFKSQLYENLMWVRAKHCVFLGAGAVGTSEILLRSKTLGMHMSPNVGKNLSGNGDILAFGYNTNESVNAIGNPFPSPGRPIGPTISGIIDCRAGHENPLDGFVIQEGAVPKALAPLFQVMLEMLPGSMGSENQSIYDKLKHKLASAGSILLGPYYKNGSVERTQVYLVMSHDANQAVLTLKDDKPMLEFIGVGRSHHVRKLNALLQEATEAVGGTFVQNPFYACLGQQEVSVHPIGGACMSPDGTGEYGATNHHGELFTGTGETTYPNLIVTDAAVIPAALGVNPFATITALAERAVEHAATNLGLEIDLKTSNGILDLFGEPTRSKNPQHAKELLSASKFVKETQLSKKSGFGFSEVMEGYIHVGDNMDGDEKGDFEVAARTARGLCEGARFFLSVRSWDEQRTVHRSDHSAMLTGTFDCAALPGSPFMVQRGDFQLFSVDHLAPGTRNLTYDFDMTAIDKRILHFHGYKIVDSSVALAPWKFWSAASTLYVTISRKDGHKAGKVLARGMMHIQPGDFLHEIFTLAPTGRSFWAKAASTASFMTFFARKSASLFFTPFIYLQYPTVTYTGYINDTPPDQTYEIFASDGVATYLHMWEPKNSSIETKDLFFVPGASVDHQIFALPTIEVNAVNYFTRAGYRVWVTVHRICQLMVAEQNWTTFDSRLDIKACLQLIRKQQGPKKIYTVCHCMGAVAFSSGLLDGTIPADWILGISSSQVLFNPIWSPLNLAKAKAAMSGSLVSIEKLYKWIAGNWISCSSSTSDTYFQQGLNQLLRFYPDSRKEICSNVSCHRCSLVFGRLWEHNNLNEATHRQINRFFGGVNMTLLHLLMRMGSHGHVTSNAPLYSKLTGPENVKRLAGIPIFLFNGAENQVLSPESTDKTYEILRDQLGGRGGGYDGMGHGYNANTSSWTACARDERPTVAADGQINGTRAERERLDRGLMYERVQIPKYGHLDCWMGRRAYRDVYPIVRQRVDRVCRGRGYRYDEPDWQADIDGKKDV